jgi:hypothetical protein
MTAIDGEGGGSGSNCDRRARKEVMEINVIPRSSPGGLCDAITPSRRKSDLFACAQLYIISTYTYNIGTSM